MRFFRGLRRTLRAVAAAQTLLILGVVYFLLALPVTLLMKLLRHDPLISAPEDGSYWRARPDRQRTLEGFMRQF